MDIPHIVPWIAKDIGITHNQAAATVALLQSGATVPFISRYRKEKTGNLEETNVRLVSERLAYYIQLEERKQTVLDTIRGQEKLTPDLEKEIVSCLDKQKLEDIYLPYKPKRRTKATIAREKGLEPLADIILSKQAFGDRIKILDSFIDAVKGVGNSDDALRGALDIVVEKISDDRRVRQALRVMMQSTGKIISKAAKDWEHKKSKFEAYYAFSETLRSSAGHRLLAIRRGAQEGVLQWSISIDDVQARVMLQDIVGTSAVSVFKAELEGAVESAYKKYLYPSLEAEVFLGSIEAAEKEAIRIFAKNLRTLLLAAPAGHRVIMGVDPGLRTGCKVAVIDGNGNYKDYKTIFPFSSARQKQESAEAVIGLCRSFGVELIAVGNGTASKEARMFMETIMRDAGVPAQVVLVSEAGASVYSASDIAVQEFPDLDVTVRGALSIARRLQDPLAELVKIDPKAIGVGQYQHDVNQTHLAAALDGVVESCVNHVGVSLNTASAFLLSYVAGIGRSLAKHIVAYRAENGAFRNKKQLLDVPKFGARVFEQSAGFLRITAGESPLDNSAIHPESYWVVEKMASDSGVSVETLVGNMALIEAIEAQRYVCDTIGLPTIIDIIAELRKPGVDPRSEFSCVVFDNAINDISDLKPEAVLPGVITNITAFGAFVDIGVHTDGLIHVSKMGKGVRNPLSVVSVGQQVRVKVLTVDTVLKRVGLELVRDKACAA